MSTESQITIVADEVAQFQCPVCGESINNTGLPPFTKSQCPRCQYDIDVPGQLGSFLLVKCLGMGGMGGVFKAFDQVLNRDVAIKVMLSSLGADEEFLNTFRKEAQSAAKLNHPNIAQIYTFGEYAFGEGQKQPYIVMEFIKGSGLATMMENGKRIDPLIALNIGIQIANALKHASSHNVFHGDVKPENILLDDKGNAKLVDFGIAALSSVRSGEDVWGTPYYIAPETLKRQPADLRTDMYSLGATLFHAIAGVPPFEGDDSTAVIRARLGNSAPALQSIVPGISPLISDIVARMLQEDPANRFQTYDALIQEMSIAIGVPDAPPATTITQTHTAVGGKKIVLHKGAKRKPVLKPSVAGDEASQNEQSDEQHHHTGRVSVSPRPLRTEETTARGSGIKIAVIAGISIFIIAIVGTIAGVTFASRAKAAKERAEQEELARNMAQTEQLMSAVIRNASEMRDKFRKNFELAKKLTAEVTTTARRIATPELRPYLTITVPDLPKYIPEDGIRKAEEAQAVPSDQQINATTGAVTNATATLVADVAKTNAPQQEVVATNAVESKEPPAQTDSDDSVQEETTPPVALPPAFVTVTNLQMRVAVLQQIMSNTDALCDWLTRTKQVAIDAGENSLEQRKALAKRLNAEYGRYIQIKSIATFSAEASAIQRRANQLKPELLKLENTFKFRAKEKERQEKLKAEAEARQKALESQQKLIEEEKSKVETVEQIILEDIKLFQFVAARRKLNEVGDVLKTQEGTSAFALVMERVKDMEAFQSYLIRKLPGYGTIKSADRRGLTFKDGQKMKWEELCSKYPQQIVRFARQFVTSESAMQELPASRKMQIGVGAAIYLSRSVQGELAVQKMVRDMLERMIKKSPDIEADFRRLLPDGVLTPAD